MLQLTVVDSLLTGLALIGYLFITAKSGEWIAGILLRKWLRRRRQPAQDRVMSEFCDAFDIDEMAPGTQKLITTKGDIVVYVIKKES